MYQIVINLKKEHFKNWMLFSGMPTFRKTYGKIDFL